MTRNHHGFSPQRAWKYGLIILLVTAGVPNVGAAQETGGNQTPEFWVEIEPDGIRREGKCQLKGTDNNDLVRACLRGMIRWTEQALGTDHAHSVELRNLLLTLLSGDDGYLNPDEGHALLVANHETAMRVNGCDPSPPSGGTADEADRRWSAALAGCERVRGKYDPVTLSLAGSRASYFDRIGRYADAATLHERELSAWETSLGKASSSALARSRECRGRATLAELDYRHALRERMLRVGLREPEERRRMLRDNSAIYPASRDLGRVLAGRGQSTESEKFYAHAMNDLTSARLEGEAVASIDVAVRLARTRVLRGQGDSLAPARIAVAGLRARRMRMGGAEEETRQEYEDLRILSGWSLTDVEDGSEADCPATSRVFDGVSLYSIFADAAWTAAEGREVDRAAVTEEVFAALQDSSTTPAGADVARMAARERAEASASGLAALLREREALTSRWRTLRGRPEGLEIEFALAAIDDRVRADFPDYFGLTRPQPLSLAAAQAMLGEDEAVLIVVPTEFGTHLFAISRTETSWTRSPYTHREIEGAVARLRSDISATMSGRDYRFGRSTAHELYQQVAAPAEALLRGKRHVFVVAAGALTSLPFAVLVTRPPSGADDDPGALRDTAWFADSHALVQLPSLQTLQFLRQPRRQEREASDVSRFVGFGDPALEGTALVRGRSAEAGMSHRALFAGARTRSGTMVADVSQIRRLSRLPGTAVELENMARALGATSSSLYLGERSTESALRALDLSRTRIISLATHGVVAGELGAASEPGLIFTPPATAAEGDDGFLSVSEITTLQLDADWVILSACNTAAGDGSEGAPGLSGLARAFFYAGARSLLASHWPVADEAAPRLTVRTIELLRDNQNLSRAEALQRSMRELRNDRTNPAWAHPGVWAPFNLIGDASR